MRYTRGRNTIFEACSEFLYRFLQYPPTQGLPFCAPTSSDCYTAASSAPQGCRTSCTGLYADVEFTEDKVLGPGFTMETIQTLRNLHQADVQILAQAGLQIITIWL